MKPSTPPSRRRQSVLGQFPGIGAEGVGLEDLRAGLHVGPVNVADQIGLLERQFVVADVEECAPGVEHGAHGPVKDVDAVVVQQISKIRHSFSVVRRET
jgi:hypothetical protein